MSRALKFLMFIYFVVFFTTGAFMVLIVNADEGSAPWIALLARNHGIVFDNLYTITNMPISRFLEWLDESGNLEQYMERLVWHLACWMTMGMFSNYYWDLFNMGKGLDAVQVERIVLPLLVSPIVFYPTYNLWLSSSSQSYILFEVIAFQSGFFWQALFTKAKPLEQAAVIPWTVNNGGARGAQPKAQVSNGTTASS